MKSACTYSAVRLARAATVALGLLAGARGVGAQDPVELPLNPFVRGVLAPADGYLEVGPQFERSGLTLSPRLRLPIDEDAEDTTVRVVRATDLLRGVFSLRYVRDLTRATGPITRYQFEAAGEYGRGQYEYFPGRGDVGEEETHGSYAFEVGGLVYRSGGRSGASKWAPQLAIRYDRSWEGADAVGVVVPGTGDEPATVRDVVREAPSATPTLDALFAAPFQFGDTQIGYAVAAGYAARGEPDGRDPFGGSGRIRLEGLVYYFPLLEEPTNVRIGVGPYVSTRVHGEDAADATEYGALLQIRVGTTLLEY